MISIKVNPHTVLNSDFSENVVYNLPDFPAYIKLGQLSTYPNFRATSHWHDDFEFILLLDDELSYDVNGHHISLRAGEGIFINSQCFHYSYSDRYADCNFICILLSPHLLSVNEYFMQQFLDPLMQNTSFPYQKLIPAISWQNMILRDLLSLYEESTDKLKPFLILEKFSHILGLLSENMDSVSDVKTNTDDIQSLTLMIGFVQKNYQNKILLRDISAVGNCCKTKCTMLFQKYLGVPPVHYVTQYRLEKASTLLRSTGFSVTEIAYICGFSNTSYFCELFHKYYHTTPKLYRNQIV